MFKLAEIKHYLLWAEGIRVGGVGRGEMGVWNCNMLYVNLSMDILTVNIQIITVKFPIIYINIHDITIPHTS